MQWVIEVMHEYINQWDTKPVHARQAKLMNFQERGWMELSNQFQGVYTRKTNNQKQSYFIKNKEVS